MCFLNPKKKSRKSDSRIFPIPEVEKYHQKKSHVKKSTFFVPIHHVAHSSPMVYYQSTPVTVPPGLHPSPAYGMQSLHPAPTHGWRYGYHSSPAPSSHSSHTSSHHSAASGFVSAYGGYYQPSPQRRHRSSGRRVRFVDERGHHEGAYEQVYAHSYDEHSRARARERPRRHAVDQVSYHPHVAVHSPSHHYGAQPQHFGETPSRTPSMTLAGTPAPGEARLDTPASSPPVIPPGIGSTPGPSVMGSNRLSGHDLPLPYDVLRNPPPPGVVPSQIHLHPLLKHSNEFGDDVPLHWDIRFSPENVHVKEGGVCEHLSDTEKSEPATLPPTSCVRIVNPNISDAWALNVTGTGRASGLSLSYVTVQDVISAVYNFLRIPMTPTEWDSLGVSDLRRSQVQAAFEARCRSSGGDRERRHGIRRVDTMVGGAGVGFEGRGGFMWKGLDITYDVHDTWVMNLVLEDR